MLVVVTGKSRTIRRLFLHSQLLVCSAQAAFAVQLQQQHPGGELSPGCGSDRLTQRTSFYFAIPATSDLHSQLVLLCALRARLSACSFCVGRHGEPLLCADAAPGCAADTSRTFCAHAHASTISNCGDGGGSCAITSVREHYEGHPGRLEAHCCQYMNMT